MPVNPYALRPRSRYAREVWKRTYVSTFRPTVHSKLSRKGSFLKTFFNPPEDWFENIVSVFSCARKTFEKGAFRKRWHHDNHVISLLKRILRAEVPSIGRPKGPLLAGYLKSE